MIRAHLSTSWGIGFNLGVSLVQHEDDGPTARARLILHYVAGDDGRLIQRWDEIDPNEATEPTLSMGHGEAVALMQALNTHFSGVNDDRLLLKDYTDERARVDKLIAIGEKREESWRDLLGILAPRMGGAGA